MGQLESSLFHTFCIHRNQLQELISECSNEASSEEKEKQPKLGDLTDAESEEEKQSELGGLSDESSEEEEPPILKKPKKLGPMEGFLFTSPAAVKVRGVLLECNPA